MNARELHQKVRTRRPSSDSTSAVTGAVGTTKVNPSYGDIIAIRAQQVFRAAGDQLGYRSGLISCTNRSQRRIGLALELVASLEDGWRRDRIGASVDTECGSGTRRIVVDYGVDIYARARFYLFLAVRSRPVRRWLIRASCRSRSGVIGALVRRVWHIVTVGLGRGRRTSTGGERQNVYERVSTRGCVAGLHAYLDGPRRSVHDKRVGLGSTAVD